MKWQQARYLAQGSNPESRSEHKSINGVLLDFLIEELGGFHDYVIDDDGTFYCVHDCGSLEQHQLRP